MDYVNIFKLLSTSVAFLYRRFALALTLAALFLGLPVIAQAAVLKINDNVINLSGELAASVKHTAEGMEIEIPGVEITLDCDAPADPDLCTVTIGSGTGSTGSGNANNNDGNANNNDSNANNNDSNANTNDGNANTNDGNANNNDGNANNNDGNANNNDGNANNNDGNANDDDGNANTNDGNANDDDGNANDDDGNANDDDGNANDDDGNANDDDGNANDDDGNANDGGDEDCDNPFAYCDESPTTTASSSDPGDDADDSDTDGYTPGGDDADDADDPCNNGGYNPNCKSDDEDEDTPVAFPNGDYRVIDNVAGSGRNDLDFGSAGHSITGSARFTIKKGTVKVIGLSMADANGPTDGRITFGPVGSISGVDLRAWISTTPDGNRISSGCWYGGYVEGSLRLSTDGSRSCNVSPSGNYYLNLALCKTESSDLYCNKDGALTTKTDAKITMQAKYND